MTTTPDPRTQDKQLTSPPQIRVQMLRLHSPDEAFRAIALLMAADKGYVGIPLAIAPRLWTAVCQRRYWLLVADSEPVGCVLWGEISTATLVQSLRQRREPLGKDLQEHGDALMALGLLAKTPALVTALWRHFIRANAQRPVLAVRHFGRHAHDPRFLLYLNGRACTDAQVRHWLGQQAGAPDEAMLAAPTSTLQ